MPKDKAPVITAEMKAATDKRAEDKAQSIIDRITVKTATSKVTKTK